MNLSEMAVDELQSKLVIEPLGDRVYIELEPMQEKVKRIMVPDDHSERTRVATVLATGPECQHLCVGDRVIVSYYTGTILHLLQYDLTDINHRIARESEIMARVKGEA